jgi:hypothetical protein
MKATIGIIADSIVQGSRYLPIRNRAAALATKAPEKDYYKQAEAIFHDFVKRWRYVKDPFGRELVTQSPAQIYKLVMGGRSTDPGVGLGYGAGDCDDAAIACGAQLAAIGQPVRICVTAPLGSPPGAAMSHVFVQSLTPSHGWTTCDPVVWPLHGYGYTAPYSRIACYDLTGKLLSTAGNVRNLQGVADPQHIKKTNIKKEKTKMSQTQTTQIIPDLSQWQDYGMAGIDYDAQQSEPLDFREYGIKDFGIHADRLGIIDGCGLGLAAEVETELTPTGEFRSWTPAIELSEADYNYVRRYRMPYRGMLGLGDNGAIYEYQYDGLSGWFKKLFKKAKKFVKKGLKAAGKLGKKLLKKLPGGKYFVKLGEKLWAISKKLVKPLTRFVGKYATKLAPVAALIPGYGPAIAAGLHTAGKIAKLMQEHGVSTHGKKGQARRLKFENKKGISSFKKALERAAKDASFQAKLRRGRSGVRVAARKPAIMRPLPKRR